MRVNSASKLLGPEAVLLASSSSMIGQNASQIPTLAALRTARRPETGAIWTILCILSTFVNL
jgi:hypothetical protein